ncbi:MAG TPA: ABC transporter permease [Methylomirabilota bacterium]|jgi:NitT/TauT family transport system permease protein|nr:ABC transporter permease [Methylomirabilota bacterium]
MARRRLVLGGFSVVAFFLAWEVLLSLVRWDPFFMTKPSLIAKAVQEQILGGRLWHDMTVSAQAFVVGFGLAVLVGIPVGLVMGWRRRAEWALDPLLTALYASPLIALAPLLIITAGVGIAAKALLVFLLAVFPFIFNTYAGVRCTDPLLVNVVRSFGGTERDLYTKVILPGVVPYIVAAARLAIGRGLVGILVGEFYAASEGLGFAISRFGDTYRLPEMFAGILVLAVVAVGLTSAVRRLEAVVAPWRTGQR